MDVTGFRDFSRIWSDDGKDTRGTQRHRDFSEVAIPTVPGSSLQAMHALAAILAVGALDVARALAKVRRERDAPFAPAAACRGIAGVRCEWRDGLGALGALRSPLYTSRCSTRVLEQVPCTFVKQALAEPGPNLADFGRRLRSKLAKFGPNLVAIGPTLTEIRPNLVDPGQRLIEARPTPVELSPHWPRMVGVLPTLGVLGPNSAGVSPIPAKFHPACINKGRFRWIRPDLGNNGLRFGVEFGPVFAQPGLALVDIAQLWTKSGRLAEVWGPTSVELGPNRAASAHMGANRDRSRPSRPGIAQV